MRLEVERFKTIIASGKAPDSILQQITDRESRIELLEAELEKYKIHINFNELNNKLLEKELTERLGRFRGLIQIKVPKARQALRKPD